MAGRARGRAAAPAAGVAPATLWVLVVAVCLVCAASVAGADLDARAEAGAVYTEDRLSSYESVWGHDEAAGGVDRIADGGLDRLDLLQALRNRTGSPRCRRALDTVLEARAQLRIWALRMDFSSVALPGAVLSGAMSHLGDYDACVGVPDAMYCLVDVEIRPLSSGKPHILDEKSPFEFPNGHNATLWDALKTSGNRRRYRRDSQQWAMCLPAGCGQRRGREDLGVDLAAAVSPLGKTLGVQLRLHLDPADCSPDSADAGSAPTTLSAALTRPLFQVGSLFILLFPALTLAACLKEDIFDRGSDELKGGKGALQSILSCFSVRKNCRALMKRKNSMIHAIQGIRVLAMFGVIAGHRALFPNMGPILNPELYENEFHTPAMMMVVNGNVIVTVFFVITGFLEARAWLTTYEKLPSFSYVVVLGSYIGRWLRLTPALAVMVAFDALWLEHLGAGPLWNQHVVKAEAQVCKDYWWTNILYINNYYGTGCMMQTWFLAAAQQMSLVTPFVMWAVHSRSSSGRSPWRGCAPLLLLLAAACAVLYACTAAYALLPATPVFPMILQRGNLLHNDNFLKQYLPTHTNAISYIVGLLAGAVAYFARARGWSPSQSARRVLSLGIPLGYVLMNVSIMLGVVYLMYESERPWLEALWAPARTLAFSVPVAWVIVTCSLGCGGLLEWFLSRTPMLVLGRLAYCVYLCHVTLVIATYAYARQPLFVGRYTFFHACAGDIFQSFLFGFLLHITVEAPMSNVLMMLYSGVSKKNVEKQSAVGESPDQPISISTLDASAVESQVSKL